MGELYVSLGSYDKGNSATATYNLSGLTASDTVSVRCVLGDPIRLDYVSMAWDKPAPAPSLAAQFATPEYVYHITNQDHHADAAADMIIIIPTSQKLLKQAQRLAAFHEQHDAMRVRIVPADELFNEFPVAHLTLTLTVGTSRCSMTAPRPTPMCPVTCCFRRLRVG